jgi:hypothetical protein
MLYLKCRGQSLTSFLQAAGTLPKSAASIVFINFTVGKRGPLDEPSKPKERLACVGN